MKNDSRSTEELINIALTEEDENVSWDAIASLQFRGTYEVLIAAQKLCKSSNIEERELGANIIGQLGIPDRTFPEESVSTLLTSLKNEQNTDVIKSILMALGHYSDLKAIEAIVALKAHSSADVRYGVAVSLPYENELAINTLIELTSDIDRDVRDWATFGLGSMIETDTKEIREALFKRLIEEENDYEIYGEALVGLAIRKDERVILPLIQELSSDEVGDLALEGAAEIGDPRLYPFLLEVKEWWSGNDYLINDAIANCQTK